jgi:hypothetical protein
MISANIILVKYASTVAKICLKNWNRGAENLTSWGDCDINASIFDQFFFLGNFGKLFGQNSNFWQKLSQPADFFVRKSCSNTSKTTTMRLTSPTHAFDCVSQKENSLQNTKNKRIIEVLTGLASRSTYLLSPIFGKRILLVCALPTGNNHVIFLLFFWLHSNGFFFFFRRFNVVISLKISKLINN